MTKLLPIPPSGRQAFTLIEMLVVIAIIALLVSIIVPAVNTAIGRARTSTVMSNMRSIGHAIQLYTMDNKNRFPVRYGYSSTEHGKSMHWQEQIQDYLGKDKDGSVFDYQKNEVFKSRNAEDVGGNHFGLNKFMFEDEPRWSYRSNIIPSPSSTVIMGEINQNTSAFDPEVTPAFDGETVTKWRISNPGNIGLYMFGDYHVEGIKGVPDTDEYPEIWKWW
jgi:prepilin-type N-terminal cleavage/methylation domain-containing protein